MGSFDLLDIEYHKALTVKLSHKLISRYFPPLKKIDLFVTEKCNLQCDYCFVCNKKQVSSSWTIIKKGIDFLLEESRDAKEITVTFFGGEPLLEFDLVRKAADYAKQRTLECGKIVDFALTTNGTIMTEEIALFAQEFGFNVLLSIDGDDIMHNTYRKFPDGSGSWDVIMGKNFDILKAIQGWIGTRITVNPETANRLSHGIDLLFSRGVNQFLIGMNLEAKWTEEYLAILAKEMHNVADFYMIQRSEDRPIRITFFEDDITAIKKKASNTWGCSAGTGQVAIAVNGDIYPCARFVSGNPVLQQFILGNIYSGFIDNDMRLALINQDTSLRPICNDCASIEYCIGGCYAANKVVCGTIYGGNPFECFLTRLRLELAEKLHGLQDSTLSEILV